MKSNQLPRDAQFASVQLSSRASWIGDLKFDKLRVAILEQLTTSSAFRNKHE